MADDQRLKGKVSFGRTCNLGNFNSARVDFEQEYFLEDEIPAEVITSQLKDRVEKWLVENGLVS